LVPPTCHLIDSQKISSELLREGTGICVRERLESLAKVTLEFRKLSGVQTSEKIVDIVVTAVICDLK
jgi:hypothetical protein